MTRNEKDFINWLSSIPYKTFESNNKVPLTHYVFVLEPCEFHISFGKENSTIVCGLILHPKKAIEKTIYKGFSWDYCLAAINKVMEEHNNVQN